MESKLSEELPLTADAILHARWLLPMTGEAFENHSLVINGNRIVETGPSAVIRQRYTSLHEYHLGSHVVMPGFINAHSHGPMSLLRGYADDLPLQSWLEQKIWPAEARWISESYVTDGARLAIAEMLLSGTTCFTDMYFFPDRIAAAATEAGIRVQLASPILDFPTVWAATAEEYISKGTRLHDEYRNSELVKVCFGPHAPYTVSDEPLRKTAMLAAELDACIHMHVHENVQEINDAMHKTGMRPLARLQQLDLLGPRMQCVHMTQLQDEEITLLAKHAVHVVHCPTSNLKLASGFCRVGDLLAAGVNVALGTDGCASNNKLDMLSELRLAALLAKGLSNNASTIPAMQALQLATVNGARALGLEEQLGTLEAGKLADIIAVDLDYPNTQPVYDAAATLVYSANANQISHVWVNGQLLVEQGKLTRMNQEQLQQIMRNAHLWSARINENSAT